jgi:hypothetical protein
VQENTKKFVVVVYFGYFLLSAQQPLLIFSLMEIETTTPSIIYRDFIKGSFTSGFTRKAWKGMSLLPALLGK